MACISSHQSSNRHVRCLSVYCDQKSPINMCSQPAMYHPRRVCSVHVYKKPHHFHFHLAKVATYSSRRRMKIPKPIRTRGVEWFPAKGRSDTPPGGWKPGTNDIPVLGNGRGRVSIDLAEITYGTSRLVVQFMGFANPARKREVRVME